MLSLPIMSPAMNHEDALVGYVQKLNTHSWEQIAPHVSERAVFIFTEGTFVGKEAAKAAFEKTFNLIKEEQFSIYDVTWTAVTEHMASCHYEYRWKGLIQGQEASGGGRGTTILVKADGRWLVTHEHLGPYPRKS
jgi:ketosteroid isomerase-like protein